MQLRDWLEKRGLSQTEFSSASDISESLICKYVSGTRRPSVPNAVKIEKATAGEVGMQDWPKEIQPNKKKDSYIYFAQDRATGHIKIGRTKNHPQLRVETGQTFNPNEIQLLGFFPGTVEEEAELHQQFASAKEFREWFRATPELLELITESCNNQPLYGDVTRQLAVRVKPTTFNQLQQVCLLLKRSQGQVVEDALTEYFEDHKFELKLQLSVHRGYAVLINNSAGDPEVLDVHQMNGSPPAVLAEQYALKYQVPVAVIDSTTAEGEGKVDDAPRDQAS